MGQHCERKKMKRSLSSKCLKARGLGGSLEVEPSKGELWKGMERAFLSCLWEGRVFPGPTCFSPSGNLTLQCPGLKPQSKLKLGRDPRNG